MSKDGVLNATTFDHYFGESNHDFIWWEILKEGEEISKDVMDHNAQNQSPYHTDICGE